MSNVVTNLRLVAVLAVLALAACTREDFASTSASKGELIETTLSLSAASVQVIGTSVNTDGTPSAPQTRTAEKPGELETRVNDVWVFQFDNLGNQLTSPTYYTIQMDGSKLLPISMMLHACEDSQILVLANTHDAAWGNDKLSLSLAELGNQVFRFTSEQEVYQSGKQTLLMASLHKQTIAPGKENVLDIKLKSLFAKIKFKYTLAETIKGKLHITNMRLFNIPDRVRLGNVFADGTDKYPADGDFVSIHTTYSAPSQPEEGNDYTWYIPQNLQGTVNNDDPKMKNEYAPANAFYIRLWVDSELDGASYTYTLYPGANTYNDFNVRNGNQYNVNVTFNSGVTDNRVTADPANCFVMRRNAQIQFDPYTRNETGGGFRYTDYVDINNADKSFDRVDILWQTGDGTDFAIGDNSGGKLVYYDKASKRVHVSSGNTDGNAVIAGYNAKGVIVWSWHIWVNDYMPAQLSNAQKYNTYRWDSDSIYYKDPRVAGHSFMMCNLGATGTLDELKGVIKGSVKPYGVYYQWGRKDPFPPVTEKMPTSSSSPYIYPNVCNLYDNKSKLLPMSSTAGEKGSFQAIKITDEQMGSILYAIRNPMTFLATNDVLSSTSTSNMLMSQKLETKATTMVNDGDWYWGHNDRLWGGVPFDEPGIINYKDIVANNGAEYKSIFDPCPAGWILPKSDAWMGFTIDGLNQPSDISKQNNRNPATVTADKGMEIYLESWQSGPVGWFPTPGWREADGSVNAANVCGGYYTSAASFNNASFILHIHHHLLNPYDLTYSWSRRSNACPVRCVREEK